jgi:hypothetical protein
MATIAAIEHADHPDAIVCLDCGGVSAVKQTASG